MKNCKFYLYTPLTQKLKRSSFLQSRINSLHTLFMACLLSFLKSAIVLKSGANFWVATLALYFFYTPFLNTDWSEYHLSSHKYIQLVEKLRCILSLPNLFPSLARRFACCQSRKPKGCGNGKRRAKLGNRLGKGNIHLSFSTSCIYLWLLKW